MEDINMNKIELLEMTNKITKVKIFLDMINGRSEVVEKNIIKLKDSNRIYLKCIKEKKKVRKKVSVTCGILK